MARPNTMRCGCADPTGRGTESRSLIVATVLCLLISTATPQAAQWDFPTDAGIVNVKSAPYNATGHGTLDDRAAIQKAISDNIDISRYAAPVIVYLPIGTYTVSGTLYARAADTLGWSFGWRSGTMLVGQDRDRTVIKLANNAAGFSDTANPRPVYITGSETPHDAAGGGNCAFRHYIENLTIQIGTGNPGAVGIDYLANNRGAIEQVTIKAPDKGYCGIMMNRAWPGPALIKETRIEGFEFGIQTMQSGQFGMTIEDLHLSNQKQIGILNQSNILSIRKLTSTNNPLVLHTTNSIGNVVLVDAIFSSSQRRGLAVRSFGRLLARNVQSADYDTVIKKTGSGTGLYSVAGGAGTTIIGEYSTYLPCSLFVSPPHTLGLPVAETPHFHSNTLSRWASVGSYGATADNASNDDADGIQNAIDAAGKDIVYLPRGSYSVGRTINVRGSIRKIVGLNAGISHLSGSGSIIFNFTGGSVDTCILENLRIDGIVQHACAKALVLAHVDHSGYQNTSAGTGPVFIEDVIGCPYRVGSGQRLYARQLNAEFYNGPLVDNNRGYVWILGIKTESDLTDQPLMTIIKTTSGSTELLGGLTYALESPTTNEPPMFINTEGSVSLSYTTSTDTYFPIHVRETRSGVTREFLNSAAGSRVPLYVGYAGPTRTVAPQPGIGKTSRSQTPGVYDVRGRALNGTRADRASPVQPTIWIVNERARLVLTAHR